MKTTLLRLCAPILAAAALTACAHDKDDASASLNPPLPTEQYPLEAQAHPEVIQLAAHKDGLTPAQGDALADFAEQWRQEGGGAVTVKVPVKAVDPKAAYVMGEAVADRLLELGVPQTRLRRIGYDPEGPAPAPVLVSFSAYEATIPECGRAWENLTNTHKNRPMGNFGCAVTANMAAQIANPGDIAAPRADEPADAQRRGVVLGKYRQGETTSTAKDTQAAGTASASSAGGP